MNVYVRELSIALAAIGIEVDIYTRKPDRDLPEVDNSLGAGVRVIHVQAGPCRQLEPGEIYQHVSQFAAGVIAFATKQGGVHYDLVYSHYWLSGWVANKLKEVWNTPFVHMYHTLGRMKNRIGTGSNAPALPDVRVMTEMQIARWADRIIAATPAEFSQLLWLYRADRRKIEIVPPGVNSKTFRPVPPDEAKWELGLSPDDQLLLFVGRIEPLKAVDTIFHALDLLSESAPALLETLRVIVIGGNPDDPEDLEMMRLRKMSRDKGLEGVVSFLGSKRHDMLSKYYAAASAVIVPSDYESFGMVALEAMASGTPVIATQVGGLAYLVKDKCTGYLIPSRDHQSLAECLMTMLTMPQKRELLGRNAARLAEQYDWSRIAERLMPVFDSVVSFGRTPAVASPRTR